MPYMPINCFPRNTTISRDTDKLIFLANIDKHDIIENVYLNIYDEDGNIVSTINNKTGKNILNTSDNTEYLNLTESTVPPYTIDNNLVDLRLPLKTVSTDYNLTNTLTVEKVDDAHYSTGFLFTSLLKNGDIDIDTITIHIPMRDIWVYDYEEILLRGSNYYRVLFKPTKYGKYNGSNKMRLQEAQVILWYNNYPCKNQLFIDGGITWNLPYNARGYFIRDHMDEYDYYNSTTSTFGDEYTTKEGLTVSTKNVQYFLNTPQIKWSLSLKGKESDILIREDQGIILPDSSNLKEIQIEEAEFIESGQQFNGIYFNVKEGTEYFYFLDVLSVTQTYQSQGTYKGQYLYSIKFKNSLTGDITSDTCTLKLGTYDISSWAKGDNSRTIVFYNATGYLTETKDTYTTNVAVELKRKYTTLYSTDNNLISDSSLADSIRYKITSSKITSPVFTFNTVSGYQNNLLQGRLINNKQYQVSSFSDVLLSTVTMQLIDKTDETNYINVKTVNYTYPTLNYIFDNLKGGKKYLLKIDYKLRNGLAQYQEFKFAPKIEYDNMYLNGSLSISEDSVQNINIEIKSENNFDIGAYQISLIKIGNATPIKQTDKITSNSIVYSEILSSKDLSIPDIILIDLWNIKDEHICQNQYNISESYGVQSLGDIEYYNNSLGVPVLDTTFLEETYIDANNYTYNLDRHENYISIYRQEYDLSGNYIKQTLVLDSLYKTGDFAFIDYGITSNRIYQYDILYHQIGTYKYTSGTIKKTLEIDGYFLSKSKSLAIDDWICAALFGVKPNLDNNLYELDPNNIWYFNLDMQANNIDFTNERTIFTNLSQIPKIGVSNTNYMSQSFTSKLGYLNEDDMYVGDNGEKLNKFAAWANDGTVKVMRLPNGYLIPVDIQLKTNTTNYAVCGEPSDISFTWTQIGDHTTTSLYAIR